MKIHGSSFCILNNVIIYIIFRAHSLYCIYVNGNLWEQRNKDLVLLISNGLKKGRNNLIKMIFILFKFLIFYLYICLIMAIFLDDALIECK